MHYSTETFCTAKFEDMARESKIYHRSPQIGHLLQEILAYWRADDATHHLIAQGILLRLFAEMKRLKGTGIGREEFIDVPFSQTCSFGTVIATIEKMFGNPQLRISDIARTLAVSQSYLYKLFRKQANCGPKRYILQHRIQRAMELLMVGRRSISAVARETGFPDVYSFSRAFKRLTGFPPSAYRDALRHGPAVEQRIAIGSHGGSQRSVELLADYTSGLRNKSNQKANSRRSDARQGNSRSNMHTR